MAENNQNSETKNSTDNKKSNDNQTTGSGASTKQAKDQNSASGGSTNNPTESAIGKDAAQRGGSSATASTGSASPVETLNNVKDTVTEAASEVAGQAKEKASTVLGEQKTTLAAGITGVADSIRHVGENLGNSQENNQVAALAGKYTDNLAQQVEKLSSYIDEREIKELMRDVEQFARRNPAVFVGGAFLLGVLAARFLKSSGNQSSGKRSTNNRSDKSLTTGNAL